MLRFMRRHRQSFIVKGVFLVLILVFVGWGVGSFDPARQTATVAVVNEVEITVSDLTQAHQNLLRAYQELYGSSFSPELGRQLDLQGRALDELITAALLRSEAKRLGLRVTDQEVADSIRAMAAFSPNGAFDVETYRRFLRFAQIAEDQFVEQQREVLLARKVENLITDGAYVSPAEVQGRYLLENQQVNVGYVKIEWRALEQTATPTDEEIAAHYQENIDSYKEPERVAFAYVAYQPSKFVDGIEVGDGEVTAFYEKRVADEFTDPPQVQLRQIVWKVPDGASEEQREGIRQQVATIAAQIEDGNFAALAQEHSTDEASAKNGGDLGWVARADLQPVLAEVAFGLAPGEVSEPVDLPDGIYIVKAEDTRGERPRPLDEVRAAIESSIRKDKSRELAQAAADEDAARLAGGESLEDVATARSLTVEQSKPLAARDFDPAFGLVRPMVEVAQRLDIGEASDVIETPTSFFIIRPTEKQPATTQPLEQVRGRIVADLKNEQAKAAAKEKGEALLAKLRNGDDLGSLAAADNDLTVKETGAFSRSGREIAKLGLGSQFTADAFKLSEAKPVATQVYVTPTGDAVVAVLQERIDPDLAALEREQDQRREGYLQRKKQALLSTFIAQLKQDADIKVRSDMLPQT